MKALVSFIFAFLGAIAHADDIVCQSVDGDLKVRIYRETSIKQDGEIRSDVMVVSNPNISPNRRTIVRFSKRAGTLIYNSSVFTGNINHEDPAVSKSGKQIAGTTLGRIKRIVLSIDQSYTEPVEGGLAMAGEVTYFTQDDEALVQDFDCIFSEDKHL